MNIKEQIAKDLLSIGAVFLRPEDPFTWASGIKSPIYCDNRLTLTSVEVRNHVENALAETIKREYPDAEVLMGTSTAGIAHAASQHICLTCPWDMFAPAQRIMADITRLKADWKRDRRLLLWKT